MIEFVVTLEIHNGDDEDMAVRVQAADPEAATDRAWAWADEQGLGVTGAWASAREAVEAGWGDQGGLPLV